MSDILAQLGTAIGGQIGSLSSRVSAIENDGGGGSGASPVDSFDEITYGADGSVTIITTYSTPSKLNIVQSKVFTYQSGNLYQILTRNGSNETIMLKTLTYDSDGNLESVSKDYA